MVKKLSRFENIYDFA